LYVLYLAIYKRFTFFSWNRYYLIGIVFLSFLLPFIHYDIVHYKVVLQPIQTTISSLPLFNNEEIVEPLTPYTTTSSPSFQLNWKLILSIVYVAGVLFSFIRLLKGLLSIKKLIQQSKKNWTDNLAVVYTNDKMPHSSFFHYIFLNNKTKNVTDREKIIYHEMQHNEKLHTIDVLFCELLKLILWFNPFVYWYKTSLQEIHEFEVDAEMTKLYNEVTYAELLLKVATGATTELTNGFSTKPLKTRLKMIFNHKTLPMKKLAFLLVFPVVALLLFAFKNIQYKTVTTIKSVQNPITIMIDAGHGGTDAGAIQDGLKEKDITLSIATVLKQKAEASGYKVVMSRSTDVTVGVKNRATLANEEKVDLLISIHVNSEEKDATKNGIEYFVGKNNNLAYAKQSLLAGSNIANALKEISAINTHTEPQSREVGIWILKATNCPSVLVELGYISNDKDMQFITSKDNQNLIAEKMLTGITKYMATKTANLSTSTAPQNTAGKKNYPDTLAWIGTTSESNSKIKSEKSKTKVEAKEATQTNAPASFNTGATWLPTIKKGGC
jgi:N-acetylmuramoyl-L-alanine amidase